MSVARYPCVTLTEAIFARRAVRSFASRRVDDEVIRKLLRAAVQAPNAMNRQPWLFSIVQDVAQLEVAFEAVRTLPSTVARVYLDAILQGMDEAARKELEASMNLFKDYKYQSDFAKEYFHEGEVESARAAVLEVLQARGLSVPDEVRARIEACTDLTTLRAWIARAAVATSADELT